VREAVSEISGALREQSQAANDIARHVEGIAQMTQENSAAVDQTKESARALKQLASLLQGSVAQFKV
jgi:methyl-accepting chemotaxis protein